MFKSLKNYICSIINLKTIKEVSLTNMDKPRKNQVKRLLVTTSLPPNLSVNILFAFVFIVSNSYFMFKSNVLKF